MSLTKRYICKHGVIHTITSVAKLILPWPCNCQEPPKKKIRRKEDNKWKSSER